MKQLLAVAALALCVQAHADTFTMSFSGQAYTYLDNPDCRVLPQCLQESPWTGSVTFDTSSSADGTYYEADLLTFQLDSNLYSFSRVGSTANNAWDNAFVTLANGVPVSFEVLHQLDAIEVFRASQLGVTYDLYDWRGGLVTEATATLINDSAAPAVTGIPEPATGGMLLAGLLALTALGRPRIEGKRGAWQAN